MMVAHLDQLIGDDDTPSFPPPQAEMARGELFSFHHRAIALSATFREFFPDVARPSTCEVGTKTPAPSGTLAAFMQANRP